MATDTSTILSHFTLDDLGFLRREGSAKQRGEARCSQKLCFTAVDIMPLAAVLYELSLRDDCYFVKLDAKPRKNGMIRGRCFVTTPAAVGALWQKYKVTEHLMCNVQDDDFTVQFRKKR